jgi:hypothetical protein
VGAEKFLFTQELRQSIFDTNDPIFQPVTRCPVDIFLTIGNVLSHGKGYLGKSVPVERFEYVSTVRRRGSKVVTGPLIEMT